jgi:hypothetical protein
MCAQMLSFNASGSLTAQPVARARAYCKAQCVTRSSPVAHITACRQAGWTPRSSRDQCHTVMRVCAPHALAAGGVWSPSPVACSSLQPQRTATRVQTPSCCVTHCCQGLSSSSSSSSSWRGSSRRRQRSSRRPLSLSVFALDAALPFDYEAQAKKRLEAERNAADKLVIGPSPSARSKPLCPPMVF